MASLAAYPVEYLRNEALSLLSRLGQIKPFSMTMPMVRGAAVSDRALREISVLLEKGKTQLRRKVIQFIHNLRNVNAHPAQVRNRQSEFIMLKLRYNSILDQLDIFADVLSQRAEHEVGVWTAGLDVLAEDALKNISDIVQAPPLIVYLDRGHGAAIRRAKTHLPGGDENPVAVIQIPRERMVGSGIASSLVHEVGHQAASLLDLIPGLKGRLAAMYRLSNREPAWRYLEQCISEIIADVWATGHLGVAGTLGLMGVVMLPGYFQFRIDKRDPHPAPYVRVLLSCAFGNYFYPHSQWERLSRLWKSFYPRDKLPQESNRLFESIEGVANEFVEIIAGYSTAEMRGRKLIDLFPINQRQPEQLQRMFHDWKSNRNSLYSLPPALVFAIMGQAKADLALDAAQESNILSRLLRFWAYSRN